MAVCDIIKIHIEKSKSGRKTEAAAIWENGRAHSTVHPNGKKETIRRKKGG